MLWSSQEEFVLVSNHQDRQEEEKVVHMNYTSFTAQYQAELQPTSAKSWTFWEWKNTISATLKPFCHSVVFSAKQFLSRSDQDLLVWHIVKQYMDGEKTLLLI